LAPPPGSDARLRYNCWLHYAEGSAMPPVLLKLVFDRLESGPVPLLVRPVVRAIARQVKRAFVTPYLAAAPRLHAERARAERMVRG
jgi:glutathione S-transferase